MENMQNEAHASQFDKQKHPGYLKSKKVFRMILITMGLVFLSSLFWIVLSEGHLAMGKLFSNLIAVGFELFLMCTLLYGYGFGRILSMIDMGRYALVMLFWGIPGLIRAIRVAPYLSVEQGYYLVAQWVIALAAVPFAVIALVWLFDRSIGDYCREMKLKRKAEQAEDKAKADRAKEQLEREREQEQNSGNRSRTKSSASWRRHHWESTST